MPGLNAQFMPEARSSRPSVCPSINASDVSQVFVDKAVEVVTNLTDTFAAGIATQSLIVLIITGLIVVGALIAPSYMRRRGGPSETHY